MNKIDIINKVSEALVEAGSTFRQDQKESYVSAINQEKALNPKWVLENVLLNAEVAQKNRSPLCDDTGIPHLFLEIGRNQTISSELLDAINSGVAKGLQVLPGRPMAVKGDDIERIEQSLGMYDDPSMLAPAPIIIKQIDEDILRLTVLMLGGGPAIRGITKSIFHKHDINVVIDEIVDRATDAVSKLGCSPCTLAVGVGRSQYEATSMMMEAMVYGDYNKQNNIEKTITAKVNQSNIGALGLGGSTSVLATFIKVGPQRASGVRVVAIRPCCCFEPRRASVVL